MGCYDYNINSSCSCNNSSCDVCNTCVDFSLKRNDNKPNFKVEINDCDQPFDLTGLIIEASMWFNTKLRYAITDVQEYLQVADTKSFEKILVGNIIQVSTGRNIERMLVVGFDETAKKVLVLRAQFGTTASAWAKATSVKVLKFINNPASSEMVYQDVQEVDGSILKDQLMASYLVYSWKAEDTCLPGCYIFEFKIIKMIDGYDGSSYDTESNIPEICTLGAGVEWIRRFPTEKEGFLVNIFDTPTVE